MAQIAFTIEPNPSCNDHEVRIFVDGADLLGDDHLGIDPHEFFAQFSRQDQQTLLIGRCAGCGTVGCDDRRVSVMHEGTEVTWRATTEYSFNRRQYDEELHRASTDHSWEDATRRAERLTEGVLRGCQTQDGFVFDWASARISVGTVTLSFVRPSEQKLLEFRWDETTDLSALEGAERIKQQLLIPKS